MLTKPLDREGQMSVGIIASSLSLSLAQGCRDAGTLEGLWHGRWAVPLAPTAHPYRKPGAAMSSDAAPGTDSAACKTALTKQTRPTPNESLQAME